MASGIAIMFDVTERGSALQAIATIPEFFWELSLGIYCIVKGFRPRLRSSPWTRQSGSLIRRARREKGCRHRASLAALSTGVAQRRGSR